MTALFCIFLEAVQYRDLQVILFVIFYFLLIEIDLVWNTSSGSLVLSSNVKRMQ